MIVVFLFHDGDGMTSQISASKLSMIPSSISELTADAVNTFETDASINAVSSVTFSPFLALEILP